MSKYRFTFRRFTDTWVTYEQPWYRRSHVQEGWETRRQMFPPIFSVVAVSEESAVRKLREATIKPGEGQRHRYILEDVVEVECEGLTGNTS